MDMKSNYKKKKNRKGVSTIIVTVLLIGLTIVAVGVVWAVVNNMVKEKIVGTEACFGNFGKVSINSQYTCYRAATKEFQFSLSIGDIDVEKVIVAISSAGNTKTYTIPGKYADVKNYTSGTYDTQLSLPEKNAGTTYITSYFNVKPDSVKIAPVINGQQCDVSDNLEEVDYCS